MGSLTFTQALRSTFSADSQGWRVRLQLSSPEVL